MGYIENCPPDLDGCDQAFNVRIGRVVVQLEQRRIDQEWLPAEETEDAELERALARVRPEGDEDPGFKDEQMEKDFDTNLIASYRIGDGT